MGINRLGFDVTSATKPRTGICRIAGSATCNFLELAPNETQRYSLTLVPYAAGTYTIKGWSRSTSLPGGSYETIAITVH